MEVHCYYDSLYGRIRSAITDENLLMTADGIDKEDRKALVLLVLKNVTEDFTKVMR